MPRAKEPMAQRSVRLPTELWERVRQHAESMSERHEGTVTFSDSEAIRDILTKHFRAGEAESPTESGRVAKGAEATETKSTAKAAKKGAKS